MWQVSAPFWYRQVSKLEMKMSSIKVRTLGLWIMAGVFAFAAAVPCFGQDEGSASAMDVERVPLKISLPKAMFAGTPRDIRTDNLEKQTGKPRGPFLAPKGATNVAAGKEVSASDQWPIIGLVEMVTDGDKDAGDGSFIEFGPGRQWVQIDLGAVREVYAVVFWHFHAQARVYKDVIIQGANDPDFISGVEMFFNNDHDNSSGLGLGKDKEFIETNDGRLVDAKGAKVRYVRLYSNGSTSNEMNHYIEVEVYGKPMGE